ncbi:MAG TPA: TIR domain-containing protein [Ktedonobacteraceae bacterium]|nr:TIR domain-containing protein [Ktedonobacteraceae bacterium]
MEEMQTPARIFVSYAKEDREYYTLLERTASHLVHQGIITLWNPHDHIVAGTPVREEISRQLQEASLIFLLFSPDYLADEACYEQMQQAIQIGEQEPDRVWIILLRPCLWTEIWDAITNKQHFHFLPRGHRALSTWPPEERDEIAQNIASEIIDFVGRARQRKSATQGSVKQPAPAVQLPNPYRGLLSFRIEDAPFFCGREKLTDEILEKIKHMLHARSSMNKEQRLLAIIGASGAGKSSLLHAGVLPRLMRGELAGSEAWLILRTLTLYADNNPLDNLADVLCDHLPAQERRSVKDRLNESTSELGFIVNDILRHARRDHSIPSGTYVVLVIDQFEECLKQSTQEGRQQFIKLLVTAATRPEYPLLILMTCRANFYEQLMKHSDLFELVRAHEAMLDRPMTFREMAAAIERPLENLNDSYGSALRFEEGLVDQIIADFHADFPGQIDALPFLQFTLFELFVHRDQVNHLITNQAYKDVKEGHAALAKHAEDIYKPFQEQEQEVRKLFLKLVKISMDNDLNSVIGRLRVNYAHILPPDTPAFETERATMEKMIQAFVKGRLLTVDGRGEQRTLEISHEILLRTWPRLEMWIRKDEDALFQKNSAT